MKSCCRGLEKQFGEHQAKRDLRRFRRRGASRATRMLVDAIVDEGVAGATVLDIGGGVGAVQHLLLSQGAARTLDVDVSHAYIESAREEGVRRGNAGRMAFQVGDFVDLATELEPSDIVTLDRVICCYPDMERLVRESAGRAERLYGLVYPRSNAVSRLAVSAGNLLLRLWRSDFRAHVHDTQRVDELIRSLGFERRFHGATIVWQVFLYGRTPSRERHGAGRTAA
ncbi:MAG: class I SAM-dependent methyltransferase [Gemmatimonadota bacterium]